MNRRFTFVLGAMALLAGSAFAQSNSEPVQGLIIKLKPQVAASASDSAQRESSAAARVRLIDAVRAAGVVPQGERSVGSQGHHLLQLASAESGSQLQATMARLRLQPDVLAVEPDVRIKRLNVPNDPGYSSQWHLQSPTVVAAGMNMPLAWDTTTGSSAITVAVVDTGVRFTHPDLTGRVLPGYDFVSDAAYANDGNGRDADATDPGDWVTAADRTSDPAHFGSCDVEASSWHGTFITGQIAAVTNNSQGIAGLNWVGSVLPVRVAGKCGALLSDLLDGLRWAAGLSVSGVPANTHPARVINLSFGGDQACSTAYQDVINEITNAGALLVVAAGNESAAPSRPADCKRVLAVGAAQADGRKTSYSNYGSAVALIAPGGTNSQPIYSLGNLGTQGPTTDSYSQYLGTSFSAPQAAGVASLMLAVNPSLTPDQLVLLLKQTARPHVVVPGAASCSAAGNVACNCTTTTCGAGLLDGAAAVAAAIGGSVTAAVIAPIASVPVGTTVQLDGSLSTAVSGSSLRSYQWAQVSGAAVAIQNANTAVASITLPATAGSFTFSLTVTDSVGRSAQSTVTVVSTGGSSSTVVSSTTTIGSGSGGGGGGGATSWVWGLALWAWVTAVWLTRRRASKCSST